MIRTVDWDGFCFDEIFLKKKIKITSPNSIEMDIRSVDFTKIK